MKTFKNNKKKKKKTQHELNKHGKCIEQEARTHAVQALRYAQQKTKIKNSDAWTRRDIRPSVHQSRPGENGKTLLLAVLCARRKHKAAFSQSSPRNTTTTKKGARTHLCECLSALLSTYIRTSVCLAQHVHTNVCLSTPKCLSACLVWTITS